VNIVLLSDIVRQKLLALLQAYLYLLPTNSFVAASFGAVAVVAIFTTARLCRFVRPDWPMLAPFLVWLSKWLAFPTAFAVAAGGVGSLLLSTLVAYSLGNSDNVKKELVFLKMKICQRAVLLAAHQRTSQSICPGIVLTLRMSPCSGRLAVAKGSCSATLPFNVFALARA